MAKKKVRVYIKDPNVQMLQQGGGAVTQPQMNQEELVQLIQMFAQLTGQDPQVLMNQVSGLQGQELQAAIDTMTQTLQEASANPQMQQQMQPQPQQMQQPMQQAMARYGGAMQDYAKKIAKEMKKKTGGLTSNETYKTVQDKNSAIVKNAIGKNFAEYMIDQAGINFMERNANPRMYDAGGTTGFENPFLDSYQSAMWDATMDEWQSANLRRERAKNLDGVFYDYTRYKMKGPNDFKAKFDIIPEKDGGGVPSYKKGGSGCPKGKFWSEYAQDCLSKDEILQNYRDVAHKYGTNQKDWQGRSLNNEFQQAYRDFMDTQSTYDQTLNPYAFPAVTYHVGQNLRNTFNSMFGTNYMGGGNVNLPMYQDGKQYDEFGNEILDETPYDTDTNADKDERAVYTDDEPKPGDEGYNAYIRGKIRGDISKVFEGARVEDADIKYGIFGRPNPKKGKKGRPKRISMTFGYPGATSDADMDMSNLTDQEKGRLADLYPNLTEEERIAKYMQEKGASSFTDKDVEKDVEKDVDKGVDEETDYSDRIKNGVLLAETDRQAARRDRRFAKRLEGIERRAARQADRNERRHLRKYGTPADPERYTSTMNESDISGATNRFASDNFDMDYTEAQLKQLYGEDSKDLDRAMKERQKAGVGYWGNMPVDQQLESVAKEMGYTMEQYDADPAIADLIDDRWDVLSTQTTVKKRGGSTRLPKYQGDITYTYEGRPEARYKKDAKGNWLISLPSTKGKFIPIKDPKGTRTKLLNAQATPFIPNASYDVTPAFSTNVVMPPIQPPLTLDQIDQLRREEEALRRERALINRIVNDPAGHIAVPSSTADTVRLYYGQGTYKKDYPGVGGIMSVSDQWPGVREALSIPGSVYHPGKYSDADSSFMNIVTSDYIPGEGFEMFPKRWARPYPGSFWGSRRYGGNALPQRFNGGNEDVDEEKLELDIIDKTGIDMSKAAPFIMAGAQNFADVLSRGQLEGNESLAYNLSMNTATRPADAVGTLGSFADTTGAPTFMRDRHQGFTGGYLAADQPAMYPGYMMKGKQGGSMGGYNLNEPVYMTDDEIDILLKSGGKIEYYD